MTNPSAIFLLTGSVLMISSVSVFADKITLKNGTVIQGTITTQDAEKVEIQTTTGPKIVEKKTIRRMEYMPDEKTAQMAIDGKEKAERAAEEKATAERRAREEAETKRIEEETNLRTQNEALRAELAGFKKQKEKETADASRALERSGWSSIWRSLVLPGWGQYYRGDKKTASVFFAGTLGTGVYLYNSRRRYLRAQDDYTNASRLALLLVPTRDSTAITVGFLNANFRRNDLRDRANPGNLALGFLTAIYITNVFEALFFGRKSASASAYAEPVQPDSSQLRLAFSVQY